MGCKKTFTHFVLFKRVLVLLQAVHLETIFKIKSVMLHLRMGREKSHARGGTQTHDLLINCYNCFDQVLHAHLQQALKECFESQDISKLQEAIRSLPESEARYHMKRCVDSGLWVPSKEDEKTSQEDGFVKKNSVSSRSLLNDVVAQDPLKPLNG